MRAEVLGLIPARGGSKGIPGKNKRLVGGKPLISYSIDAAKRSSRLTQIAVSSDDPDILEIARDAGVLALERPDELAEDTTPIVPVIRQVLDALKQGRQMSFDCVALLQPTAPLRAAEDIDAAIELFFNGNRNPVCSVYKCEDNHPARMYTIESGKLAPLVPEWSTARRQDLPAVYHRNGALYVFGEREVEQGAIITRDMTPYVMPFARSANVDVPLDLVVLEALLKDDEHADQ